MTIERVLWTALKETRDRALLAESQGNTKEAARLWAEYQRLKDQFAEVMMEAIQ